MLTFWPRMRFNSVDFPTLGRPTKLTKPDRNPSPVSAPSPLWVSSTTPDATPGPGSSAEPLDAHAHRRRDLAEAHCTAQRRWHEPRRVCHRHALDHIRRGVAVV